MVFVCIVCASCRQQGHVGSRTLLQQNPPVLNWGCRLSQADLYNGREMFVCVLRSYSWC